MYLLYCYLQWRSILVSRAESEEGPKNPLEGTTVKPVVSASYAQSGVDAGGRRVIACGGRAVFNGMKNRDPVFAETGNCAEAYSQSGFSDFCTIPDVNLHCGATRLYAVNAVCSVACLAWAGRERGAEAAGAWPCALPIFS